ncbi:MAG: glycosyltransferase [Flavobacteriales bacterium]|nr:glycosyltransferase [Flavobacteriales bacterium]
MPPKVSVVITCYNLGAYLPEALASIPPRPDVEVIVVDDGSTDPATRDVIAALDRARCTVIEQPNMGLAKARNNGIAKASAPYIIPFDADNRMRPVFVERAIAVLDAEPAVGVVYGDAEYFEGRSGRWTVGAPDFRRLLVENHIDACACIRRSLWERMGGYDEHMPCMGWEDWDLWLRCTVAGVEFRYVPEVFFEYRVRAGSMITDTRTRQEELVAYIFGKPQLRFLAPLRKHYMRLLRPLDEQLSTPALVTMLRQRALRKVGRIFGRKG